MAAADPDRRAANARYASIHSWARTADRAARTRPARRASDSWERWERLVDPDGSMKPTARRKAAEARRTAHYVEMGRRSGAARRAKRTAA
ncbi:hypothetical protein [Nocardiopsis sp. NPDC057823]|uniref:hypothetical protein n=1 Tax=Nocardiopsis sp. NPDC057823 TaxID=3346256 RepID=UPI00366F4135